jgi:hypothetical protein
MTGSRRSALFLIAALLVLGFADAATTERAQAQDTGRGRDNASPARPDDKGARVDEAMRISGIRSHLALVRIRMKQIRDMVTDDVLREMLYMYRGASDIELRAYVEFLESEAGNWFFKTIYQGQQRSWKRPGTRSPTISSPPSSPREFPGRQLPRPSADSFAL